MIGSHAICDPIIFMCEFNGKKRSVRDYFPKPLLLRNTGASCGVVDSVPSFTEGRPSLLHVILSSSL